MEPNIYCFAFPAKASEPSAVRLRISDDAWRAFRELPRNRRRKIIVQDMITGRLFQLNRYPCGGICCCGAQAKELTSSKK